MHKKAILIDIWWTSIIWWLYIDSIKQITDITEYETPEYDFQKVLLIIDEIVWKYKQKWINYLWISLNWQINNGYVYFSRILWWIIEQDLSKFFSKRYSLEVKIDNDVNCMALGYNYLSEKKSKYMVLLNLWTGIRSSYVYEWKLLKWSKWFFWEIRDSLYVKELEKEININDLVCGRGISNIFNLLYWEKLSAKEIYINSQKWEKKAQNTIEIFIKYLIQILLRISYSFNPDEIVIDASLKKIFEDKYDEITWKYKELCEPHFITIIKIADKNYTNLYWALIL